MATRHELRQLMKQLHVCQWEVADELKMSEGRLSRMFRRELDPDDADAIQAAILRLAKRNNAPRIETAILR